MQRVIGAGARRAGAARPDLVRLPGEPGRRRPGCAVGPALARAKRASPAWRRWMPDGRGHRCWRSRWSRDPGGRDHRRAPPGAAAPASAAAGTRRSRLRRAPLDPADWRAADGGAPGARPDRGAALDALWWWLATRSSREPVDPSWTTRELLAAPDAPTSAAGLASARPPGLRGRSLPGRRRARARRAPAGRPVKTRDRRRSAILVAAWHRADHSATLAGSGAGPAASGSALVARSGRLGGGARLRGSARNRGRRCSTGRSTNAPAGHARAGARLSLAALGAVGRRAARCRATCGTAATWSSRSRASRALPARRGRSPPTRWA